MPVVGIYKSRLVGTSQFTLSTNFIGGRLTLASGTPVTTADQTAKTVIYWVPYYSANIALWTGQSWVEVNSDEVSVNVPSTTNTVFDIFGYLNQSGGLSLETTNWTNDTTRAVSISLTDGLITKSTDKTRLLLGTSRTTGVSGKTEDSFSKRWLSNMFNREIRPMLASDATAVWTYTLNTYRQANANTANQCDWVTCFELHPVYLQCSGVGVNDTTAMVGAIGIGIDSTSVDSSTRRGAGQLLNLGIQLPLSAEYYGYAGNGRHFGAWLEKCAAVGTTVWVGTTTEIKSGISGYIYG